MARTYESRVSAMSEFLRGEARDGVDGRRGRDVAGADQVLGDRVRATVGQHGAKSLEVARLVERRLESLGTSARDGQQRVEADPDEREVPVEHADDSAPPSRRRLCSRLGHSTVTADGVRRGAPISVSGGPRRFGARPASGACATLAPCAS